MFHYLIHKLYPTNPHLFQEILHYRTPYLLSSLISTICLLSSLTSTNLILPPSLPNPSLSSFVGSFAIGLKAFPLHHRLKKLNLQLIPNQFLSYNNSDLPQNPQILIKRILLVIDFAHSRSQLGLLLFCLLASDHHLFV